MPISDVDFELVPAEELKSAGRKPPPPVVKDTGPTTSVPEAVNKAATPAPVPEELPVDPKDQQPEPADDTVASESSASQEKQTSAKNIETEQPPSALDQGGVRIQQPPVEKNEDGILPEWVDGGGDFANRIDTVRSRIGDPGEDSEELHALLEQAVTLLEGVAAHPAIADYGELKQRLDNVEQILNSSANVR